jgi:hypothetical protein
MNLKLLKSKLDELQARLDEVLKTEFIDKDLIEDVELQIDLSNFAPRSSESRAIFSLREILIKLPKTKGKLNIQSIEKKHILAAESLIRMNRCKDLATQVLIAAIESDKPEVPELAAKALGELEFRNDDDEQTEESTLSCRYTTNKSECSAYGKKAPCYICT